MYNMYRLKSDLDEKSGKGYLSNAIDISASFLIVKMSRIFRQLLCKTYNELIVFAIHTQNFQETLLKLDMTLNFNCLDSFLFQ